METYRKSIPKKESVREDAYFENSDLGIFVLGDGLFGSNGTIGAVLATSLIGYNLESEFTHRSEDYQSETEIINLISETVKEANERLTSITNGESTIDCLVVRNNKAYVLHLGDGRIYQVQNNNSINEEPQVTQITKDQSLEQVMCDKNPGSQIEDYLVKDTNAGPLYHMGKNLFTEVPVFNGAEIVRKEFTFDEVLDVKVYPVREGDKFLLTTDGLTNRLTNDEIVNRIKEYVSSKEILPADDLLNNLENLRQSPEKMLEYVVRNYGGKHTIISLVSDYMDEIHVTRIKDDIELSKQEKALHKLLIDDLPTNPKLREKLTEKTKYDDTLMVWIDTESINQKYQNRLATLTGSQKPVLDKLSGWEKRINDLKDENSIYLVKNERIGKSVGDSIEGRIDEMLTSLVDTNKEICLLYDSIKSSLESPLDGINSSDISDGSDDLYSFFSNLGTKQVELELKVTELEKKKKTLTEEKNKLSKEKDILASEKKNIIEKVVGLYNAILSTTRPIDMKLSTLIDNISRDYNKLKGEHTAEKNKNILNQPILDEYKKLKGMIEESQIVERIKNYSSGVDVIQSTLSNLSDVLNDHVNAGYDDTDEIKLMTKEADGEFTDVETVFSLLPEDVKRRMSQSRGRVKNVTDQLLKKKESKEGRR
jgi:PPM family protein phosphatase